MNAAIYAAIATGLFGVVIFFFTKLSERKSVTTALLAEIRRLLVVTAEHRAHWSGWIGAGVTKRHPLFPFSCDVYKKHIANLGKVSSCHVGQIVQFYGYINFLNTLQKARTQYTEQGDADEFDRMYEASLSRLQRDYSQTFVSAFDSYGIAPLPKPFEGH